MSASPAPEAAQQQRSGKIAFRFCRECANMLYPKENKDTDRLEFACRTCAWKEEATSSCVFRNELANTVGDTAGITQDVGQDPTVGGDAFYPPSQDPLPDVSAPPAVDAPLPEFCTLCGGEIKCEFCGQDTDRGCWLEVDDAENALGGGMLYTPPDTDPPSDDDEDEDTLVNALPPQITLPTTSGLQSRAQSHQDPAIEYGDDEMEDANT